MQPAIRTQRLTKHFGRTQAVVDLNLEVHRGEIFGFLGPNGAGKTTTIRLLLDLLRPTGGSAEILGMDVRDGSVEIRRRTGYLPGELALYENMEGGDLLRFLERLRGGVDAALRDRLTDRLGVPLDRPIGQLSHGNKQKVGLIQAFMHRPEVLILDEPTSGLDPLMQQEFNALLREFKDEGATIFLSSHSLGEVERTADRVAMIRDGDLIVVEEVVRLKERALRKLEIHFAAAVSAEQFRDLPGVKDVHVHDSVMSLSIEGSPGPALRAATEHEIVNLISHEPDLEEIFLDYYKQADAP